MRRWLRKLILVGLLLFFGGLAWLGYYAFDNGFTKRWRKVIRQELAKRNLEMEFAKLTLDPIRGLVAKDVTLFQDREKKQVLAKISNMHLGIDLAKLVREETFLDRIELSNADLSIPFDRADPLSPRLELRDLTASILLGPERVEIGRAAAEFHGVRLELTGALSVPKLGSSSLKSLSTEEVALLRRAHDRLVAELGQVHLHGGKPPTLKIDLSGDLAKASTVQARVAFEGERFAYRNCWFKEGAAKALVTSTETRIESLRLEDEFGGFHGSGKVGHADLKASFQVDSTLAFQPFLAAFLPEAPFLKGLEWSQVQSLQCEGEVRFGEPFQLANWPVDLSGTFASGPFRLKASGEGAGTRFQDFSGAFRVQGDRWFARNLILKHETGTTKGKLLISPKEGVRYEAEIGMDPTHLEVLPLPELAKAFLQRWKFQDNSKVLLTVSGARPANDLNGWQHQGTINLSRCAYLDTALEFLLARFEIGPKQWRFSDFNLKVQPDPKRKYAGGSVTGEELFLRPKTWDVDVRRVHSTLPLAQLLRPFSSKVADHLEQYRFDQAPTADFAGKIDPRGKATDLTVDLKAPGKLTWKVLGADLPFTKPSGRLRFVGQAMEIDDLTAGLFGGNVSGKVTVADLSPQGGYSSEIKVDRVPFAALAERYFPRETTEGEVTGHFQWSGLNNGDPAAVQGAGAFHLVNGHIGSVPVLGPLSSVLEPVVGKSSLTFGQVRDLNASFRMEKQTLTFDSVQADMKDFQINGSGTANTATTEIDFRAELSNHSAAKLLIDPLYKILGRFTCTGTWKDPKWKLALVDGRPNGDEPGKRGKVKVDPSALLDIPSGILKSLTPPPLRKKP